jgi:hypothetical protein
MDDPGLPVPAIVREDQENLGDGWNESVRVSRALCFSGTRMPLLAY